MRAAGETAPAGSRSRSPFMPLKLPGELRQNLRSRSSRPARHGNGCQNRKLHAPFDLLGCEIAFVSEETKSDRQRGENDAPGQSAEHIDPARWVCGLINAEGRWLLNDLSIDNPLLVHFLQ